MPMEEVLNQVADTVVCGSIFGLTAETLIDAQMILVELWSTGRYDRHS